MRDLLQLKNLPSATSAILFTVQGGLELLLAKATERAGELLVGNEMEDAEELAAAIRDGRRVMAILQELEDEIRRDD